MPITQEIAATVERLRAAARSIPGVWDGREAILEMKNADYPHWKQMEWMGFYFQFLCERAFTGILEMPGKKYGRVEFDAFGTFSWDFKAHSSKNHDGSTRNIVIMNDAEAIQTAMEEHGHYGLILAIGDVTYNDDNRTFKQWHDQLKGGASKYERKRVQRGAGSRIRKTRFVLSEMRFICLDAALLEQCGKLHNQGRNSDGSSRKPKFSVNTTKIPDDALLGVESWLR